MFLGTSVFPCLKWSCQFPAQEACCLYPMRKGMLSMLKKLPMYFMSLSPVVYRLRSYFCSLQIRHLQKPFSWGIFLARLWWEKRLLLYASHTNFHRPHIECLSENTHASKTAHRDCKGLLTQLQEDEDPAKLINWAIYADYTYISMQEWWTQGVKKCT